MQVIDETDRLLRQSYQDWLPFVMEAIDTNKEQRRAVKIVVSATLTQDPAKLERLKLSAPRYIALNAADNRQVFHLCGLLIAIKQYRLQ